MHPYFNTQSKSKKRMWRLDCGPPFQVEASEQQLAAIIGATIVYWQPFGCCLPTPDLSLQLAACGLRLVADAAQCWLAVGGFKLQSSASCKTLPGKKPTAGPLEQQNSVLHPLIPYYVVELHAEHVAFDQIKFQVAKPDDR
jgi:hypothetical protein